MMGEYLTIFELSKYIKRSAGAIRNLVLRRKIPYRKVGGRLLFDKDEIDKWIKTSEGISLEEIEGLKWKIS
jgi:excisionase family DNA binding protein